MCFCLYSRTFIVSPAMRPPEFQSDLRLCVTLSSLSFDRHANIVSTTSFYSLRQLRRSRRSLDTDSATTLVHAFVSSRVDYCNAVLAGDPKVTTDKLQRVLNAAARVLSGTHKFDRGLSRLLHTKRHWLNVRERVAFKLGLMVSLSAQPSTPVPHRPLPVCLQCRFQTTSSLCQPRSSRRASPSSQQLWSASFFSVAGPAIWNWLSDSLKDPAISRDSFKHSLKTFSPRCM